MKAEYVNHMGSDLTVVNSARVSFDKESEWETDWEGAEDEQGVYFPNVLSSKDQKLINYLATHGHWSPFAHPQITLRYTVPIFVARQEFKHIVGFCRNEVSRRYVDDEPSTYSPEDWRSRPDGSVKQGSGGVHENSERWMLVYGEFCERAEDLYEAMVSDGVAPEQARMVLPQSMYTSYYCTGSLAAYARFFKQRSDPHAQKEIQDLAKMVEGIIKPLFPVSWDALTGG